MVVPAQPLGWKLWSLISFFLDFETFRFAYFSPRKRIIRKIWKKVLTEKFLIQIKLFQTCSKFIRIILILRMIWIEEKLPMKFASSTQTRLSQILQIHMKSLFASVLAGAIYKPWPSFLVVLVIALVMTWARMPMGQKNKQKETECRVSTWFSSPSWKTCLDL